MAGPSRSTLAQIEIRIRFVSDGELLVLAAVLDRRRSRELTRACSERVIQWVRAAMEDSSFQVGGSFSEQEEDGSDKGKWEGEGWRFSE